MDTKFRGSDWYGAVVVEITNMVPHPDADTLDITRVFAIDGDPTSGIPVIVKRGEFRVGDRAIYTGIDSILPTAMDALVKCSDEGANPEVLVEQRLPTRFNFLDPRGKPVRLKAKKLRGVFSEGLLTPARVLNEREFVTFRDETWLQPGRDLTVQLGITKYLPEAEQEPALVEIGVGDEPLEELATGGTVGPGAPLAQWIAAAIMRPGMPGWTWVTRERVEYAMRKGECRVKLGAPLELGENLFQAGDEIVVRRAIVPARAGDHVTIMVSPAAIASKPGRPGVAFAVSTSESCPFGHLVPTYDLDALRKWGKDVLDDGEVVVAREKIHGANGRAVFDGTRLWVGSRTQWKRPPNAPDGDLWWKAAIKYGLEQKLVAHPRLVIYYEVFGQVQDLKYGAGPGEVFIAVFDALDFKKGWLSDGELRQLCASLDLPLAPLVYEGPWTAEVLDHRNGSSLWPNANHIREGVVVRPITERSHPRLGRVVLKVVGEDYKLRK